MLAALHAIAALIEEKRPLSELLERFNRYSLSGEINTKVADQKEAIAAIKKSFSESQERVELDELDGLSVTASNWSFNVRPSNTEPLLRLNVEAGTTEEMLRVQDLVLRLMRSG